MPANDHACLTFPSRYAAWAGVLRRNLEQALGPDSVALDEWAIGAGRSWVTALREGVARAKHVVLVATPETFASPWRPDELEAARSALVSGFAEERIHLLLLVDTPWPSLLEGEQHLDFRGVERDEGECRFPLIELIAALGGAGLPKEIEQPTEGPTLWLRGQELHAHLRQTTWTRFPFSHVPRTEHDAHGADPNASPVETAPPLDGPVLVTLMVLRSESAGDWLAMSGGAEARQLAAQVFDRQGDVEGTIDFLERALPTTRNGEHLYFIDTIGERLGRLMPALRKRTTRLRSRLLSQIPPPAGELFETVIAGDGRSALWQSIPPGRFRMGSDQTDAERPAHQVAIQSPFALFAAPVTNAQYRAFDPTHESAAREPDHLPVVDVSWYEAVMFCRWLGARLPSEAEWEYACRAGTHTRHWSGDEEDDLARVGWYWENSNRRPHPVAQKPPNAFGLHDMHGNVAEWCADLWSDDYTRSRKAHPGPHHGDFTAGTARVVRGGMFASPPERARSTSRQGYDPELRFGFLGFRPAKSITQDH